MDLMAGASGIFGQLAVGLAGGMTDLATSQMISGIPNGLMKIGSLGRSGPKPTIDALPDKVGCIN